MRRLYIAPFRLVYVLLIRGIVTVDPIRQQRGQSSESVSRAVNKPDGTASRQPRRSPEVTQGRLEPPPEIQGRVRLGLQQRAPQNIRRHVLRGARRVAVLLTADLVTFGLMRGLVRAVRDAGALGGVASSAMESLAPRGILAGWQYAGALFVGLLATGNYGRGDRRHDPRRLFAACALATALPLWMTIWNRGITGVLVQYSLTTVLVWGALLIERRTIDRLVAWVSPPERRAPRTMFVGTAADCREAMELPAFKSSADFCPVGFVEASIAASVGALGALSDLARCLSESRAEVVVVCGYLSDIRFQDVVDVALASGCQLLSVPRAMKLAGVQPSLQWRKGQVLIELHHPVVKAPALIVKRVVDLIGATIGLLTLSPVFALVAMLIKIDSSGAVFFPSERWGQYGRRIRIWKFRTMVDGAAGLLHTNPELRAAYERELKLQSDPRITRVGKWLRRLSVDELPQLFNVLVGDMSLVGPRPKLLGEEDRYGPLFGTVLGVPPGLTGLWQVSGRNALSYEERVALDVEYVQRCSLALDLRIVAQTIPVVVRGVGAH